MNQTLTNSNEITADKTMPEAQQLVTATADANNMPGNLQGDIEEIDSSNPVKTSEPIAKAGARQVEPITNPLLDDPYEWDQCTITVVYALLPDQTVSVSVHNHKDEPIVKTFAEAEFALPQSISNVIQKLREIWPDSTISATMVLMPKHADATHRTVVVSVRAGNDTPILQTDLESNLTFPSPINNLLDELKAALPSRALKRIEKDANARTRSVTKPVARTPSKSTLKPPAAAPSSTNKTQLSLF